MSSFDDTILKAKEMLDIAAKKTDEFVSVSKQKIKISSLSSDLKTAYAKLGKRCYTELKNNEVDDPEVAAIIEEIKGYIVEIKALKDDVDNIEGKIICNQCGNKVNKDCAFCNFCGAKIN